MKVLITGVTGFVANSIKSWLVDNGFFEKEVQLLGLRSGEWKNESLKGCEVVVHCAAIVHQLKRDLPFEQYQRVNIKLTIDLAQKAKEDGVKLFVFMSTKGVYGLKKNCFQEVVVNENTPVRPYKKYGMSKLKAEQALQKIHDDTFKIAIIRAPFIYGKGCPGNYQSLKKMVLKYHFVPKIKSKISFLYIDNLCELVRQIILQKRDGVFLPQNLPVRHSSEMAYLIAKNNNISVLHTALFNPIIRFASLFIKIINSAFGSSYYSEKCSQIDGIDYQVVGFEDSIRITES